MLTLSGTQVHRPVWPLGLCAGHEDPTPWPCEQAVAALHAEYGDGLRLAAHLWDLYEDAGKLAPTADPIALRRVVIVRPLDAVEAWAKRPRVVEHWAEAA
ncbi:hypothetical protein [Actinoplanes regularis]|uniref:hypothetical protein n=1 Tax=Actinoplanes regularis TaxID=52697 RepID=UPI0024A407EC|nr:hypothetical protein [Actinoplanes regularis]GLW35222.1 hypothetical protein Areg01_81580 [Actinoplanes regularis]